NAPKISDYLSIESKERFNKLKKYLNILDVEYEINESIVRGLDYYDHNVWEYVTDEENVAIGGGGRYNSLVENLEGPSLPAVGFGIGVDRLMLEIKKILPEGVMNKVLDAYVLCVSEEEKIHGLALVQDMRLNGLMADINSNNLSLKSQFKVADSLNSKFLVFLNNDDLQKGIIKVKDNATKEEFEMDESEVVDWIAGNI
ncbi:MAG: ATP phosphoribosyltransferase regulatory subunit, partial [Bacilli bacterium]|nr:ATP phosphoribosyltransferase regulatory subunit [Bacilli bacterium]